MNLILWSSVSQNSLMVRFRPAFWTDVHPPFEFFTCSLWAGGDFTWPLNTRPQGHRAWCRLGAVCSLSWTVSHAACLGHHTPFPVPGVQGCASVNLVHRKASGIFQFPYGSQSGNVIAFWPYSLCYIFIESEKKLLSKNGTFKRIILCSSVGWPQTTLM